MVCVEDPSLQHLRSLLTLAEELHFGRASARLYLTQSALSQQIRSLERRLGVQLFTRTSRRVQLTAAGRALLPLVREVLDATDDLREAVSRPPVAADVLRLGLSDCAASLQCTQHVIDTVTTLHPHIELSFRVLDMVELMTALVTGTIDAAFTYLPAPDGLRAQPLTIEPRMVCISASDPLAHRPSVWMADLADRPVVSLAPEVPLAGRAFWAVDPRADGSPVRYTNHHVTRVESLLAAVSLDGAVGFVPSVAAELYPRPDIRYVAVHDLVPCTFGVVWRESDAAPAVAVLEDVCRRLYH